jgi:3',5'-cyclic-AMP phosphodiesterase
LRTVLAQISDPHLQVGPEGEPAAEALAAAVATVAALDQAPDAVLLSGDVVNEPAPAAYELARRLTDALPMPVHVLPGNHDDVEALRAAFDAPGRGGEPLQYAVPVGGIRLIALDTSVAGREAGALGPGRLAWLEAELAADTETPTVLAMHHPPILTGVPSVDVIALDESDRVALGELVAAQRQVKGIVGGHVHRAVAGVLNGCPVFVCPSTYLQVALDLDSPELSLVREPPCIAIHVATGAELVSHLQPVGDYGPRFVP